MMGAAPLAPVPKWAANFSVSIVAEVMITFRSSASLDEASEVAEEEVDVEGALVGLVDDDRVVATQVGIARQLGQQDAVGHRLDEGAVADLVGEAHAVADEFADGGAELVGDPCRDRSGRKPSGLGVADHCVDAPAEFEAELRDLGRLARSGLARDHDDLVVTNRVEDLLAARRDRQVGRIVDLGHAGAALLDETGAHGYQR